MAGKSDYLELEILDHVLGVGAYTAPTAYVALYTVAPTDAGGGTEAAYTGYARVAVAGKFSAAASGASANTAEIAFPEGTGGSETAVAFGILDAATLGNLLYWGTLSTSRAVGDGITPRFAVGELVLTED